MKSRISTAAALVLVGAGGYALLSHVTKTAILQMAGTGSRGKLIAHARDVTVKP
jgi:hypothetical protein